MGKTVAIGGNWKAVEVPGELAGDENFAFLSAFEECLPAGTENEEETNPGTSQNRKAKKRKANDELKTLESDQEKKKKKRKKLKKRKKNKVSAAYTEENDDITVEDINEDIENDALQKMEEEEEEEEETSMAGWASLSISDKVLRAIADMGFVEPTEIQKLVIPSALRDHLDIIGAAETGSGKTLAFGIPVIEHLLAAKEQSVESNERKKGIRALILAPTRELVMQIKNHILALLKYTSFKVASVVGGLSQQKQERILKYIPEIVIATPGRFLALMTSAEANSCLSNWSRLQCLVIDETDRMIEKGHFEDLQQILDTIRRSTSKKLQTFVFSATLTYTHPAPKKHTVIQTTEMTTEDKINRLIEITGIRKEKHKIIDITGERGTAETVIEARMNCRNLLEKDASLVYLLKRYTGRTLVFTNSIDAARRLHGILMQLEHKPIPLVLHAKMTQKKRLNNLEKFASAENSTLLATDVAARGLDIPDVEHVIHYQVPKTAELYIHRSGRTARATKEGLAILLVDPQDVQYYQRICRNLSREKELPIFPMDSPELYSVLKEQVEVATAVESLEHRLKKMESKQSWFKKAAASADLDLDESEYKNDTVAEMSEELRRDKKALLSRLRRMLSQPLPASNVHVKKTRYVTAEIASNYDRSTTQNAIASLMENEANEELLKKKCRAIFVPHFRNRRNRRKKRRR